MIPKLAKNLENSTKKLGKKKQDNRDFYHFFAGIFDIIIIITI